MTQHKNMRYPVDVDAAWFDGEINAAILNLGEVGFGPMPMVRDLVDTLVPAVINPTNVSGFGVTAEFKVPAYNPLYDRVHFHVVLSTSPTISYDGRNTVGMVSERFSENGTCFFLEYGSIFNFPGAGANVTNGSPQIGATVRFIELNIDGGLSPLYLYWRYRFYNADLLVHEGDFNGIPVVHYSSPSLNTGIPDAAWPQASRICDGSTWAVPAFPEVYVGESPDPQFYVDGGSCLVHADASVSPSGFRYVASGSLLAVPPGGILAANSGAVQYFLTNPIAISSPVYVCSRMKWTGGSGSWKTTVLIPACSYSDAGPEYTPSIQMQVPSGISTKYHIQVVYGTSPLSSDYFTNPSDETPDLASPYLVHYAYSYDAGQADEFSYCVSGGIIHPPASGILNTSPVYIVHVCPSTYAGVGNLYRFWRVVTGGPWIP